MATRFYAKKSFISTLVIVLIIAVGGWTFIEWTVNRIYVPEGYSLRLRYKGPPLPLLPGYGLPEARSGFAKVDENGRILEKGVLREMLGPGRHFRTPFYWERELVKDIEIAPGQIGIATSKLGKQLPGDQYLVDGDLGETEFKGVLRKVFGPGTYRVNDYAYTFTVVERTEIRDGDQVKYAGWVEIPAGFVGVVTNLASNELTGQQKGIQQKVLPPGIYPVNQKEQQIDVVEIGYRDRSIVANLKKDPQGNLVYDEAGEPMLNDTDSGIFFYSNDGFPISMDFTAIWGIMPEQAPNVISKFGNVAAVEQKVVVPQIESICRNIGAKFGAVELLVGDSRQQFQEDASTAFRTVLEGKDITLLNGLVRHIYIPQSVRLPIQQAFIADELALTREEEQKTLQIEADFREAEQMVELEQEKVRVETDKLVAKQIAEGQKTVQETFAETERLEAQIDREVSLLDAEATVSLGQAEADSKKLQEEARASKFKLAVEAFGSGEAYNSWVFANGLPEEIELNLIYAGEGTFWTDLKGFTDTMLGRQARETRDR
ncbi:MAG: SPFH domain-containing protein [Rubinisphaera brasiliensis]|uniref:Band 7 protein n=1 Tax=Rubinisphaera brasiliensis (strain ATCC 49424 / DSM 5305 / JCM 21570 / IAM 15109 / NBRC 103401 / IFAM 1448) TaxID=756272 RepID=F0SRU0_RUBBR|nr:SPFH domain-containing protein [Rubinisphaera brasiliensis]ADY60256.1 band 7 protein [Rubinisphaera brasiliensis DSM 5305]